MTTHDSKEKTILISNGWMMLLINLVLLIGGVAFAIYSGQFAMPNGWAIAGGVLSGLAGFILLCGHFTLQPNEAAVLTLFGAYVGTLKISGFRWANPFYRVRKISLRARNFNSDKLKVNDKKGNPIDIAAVVVWHVEDTYRACFDVDSFVEFVHIQSESALRLLASKFAYDHGETNDELTLRGGMDEVAEALKGELQMRLDNAGVVIDEAQIAHLAYSQEIAQAMLRRQQAEAIIAARKKIVEGAVTMVDMAIDHLDQHSSIDLDNDRKAAMISNLMVVLCGDRDAQPVVNTGTLYS